MPDTYGQGGSTAWRKTRQAVLERDKYRCQLRYDGCLGHATECDHTINLASVGTPRRDAINPDDCQAVCRPCHAEKTKQERRAGKRRPKPAPKHPGLL